MDDKELNELFGIKKEEEKAEEPKVTVVSNEEKPEKKPEEKAEEKPEEKKEEPEKEPVIKKVENTQEKKPAAPVKKAQTKPSEEVNISSRTFILMGLGVLLLTLVVCFFSLPQFHINTIEVDGNYVISDEEIVAESGLTEGSHLFLHNYIGIKDAIKNMSPYIKNVSISIKFPSAVVINVEERAKIAYVRVPDGYAALDTEGVIVELSTFTSGETPKPLVCGIEVTDAVIGQNSGISSNTDYSKAVVVLGAILNADKDSSSEYSVFENVYELRLIPGGEIFLTIKIPNGNMLQVKLADVDGINDDMNWLLAAIEQGEFDSLPDGVMDMTGEEYIYREY